MLKKLVESMFDVGARPLLICIAGPNGAGKTTFYETYLAETGLPFLNADVIARESSVDSYAAAEAVATLRKKWIQQKQSFIFETVLSDPLGEKVEELQAAAQKDYTVLLIFVGVSSASLSDARVAIRVSKGGHDVPGDKLKSRFPRTLTNLKRATKSLPAVVVFDNSDWEDPYRLIAVYRLGEPTYLEEPLPAWFQNL